MTTVNISNQTVESFLYEQTVVNKVSTVDYLTSLVLGEMDFLEIKKDMKTLESEIKQANEGKIKPRPARLLLNEL
jgi:hypothetical protein